MAPKRSTTVASPAVDIANLGLVELGPFDERSSHADRREWTALGLGFDRGRRLIALVPNSNPHNSSIAGMHSNTLRVPGKAPPSLGAAHPLTICRGRVTKLQILPTSIPNHLMDVSD